MHWKIPKTPRSPLAALSAASLLSVSLLPSLGAAAPGGLVISEVLANTASGQSSTDEFIELWNNGDVAVRIEGMKFTDGDSTDEIVPWNQAAALTPGPGLVIDAWEIGPGQAAVILDPDYLSGSMPYVIPPGTIALTVRNASLGNGLSGDDPITLYAATGTTAADVLDTYGTPVDADAPADRDDDGADGLPINAREALSIQRLDLDAADTEGNWFESAPNPGRRASASAADVAADGSGDYLTIGEALAGAAPGAVIFVGPGTYTEDLRLHVPVTIESTQGRGLTTLNGTVVVDGASAPVAITGFTHTRQVTVLDSALQLSDCHVDGAGVYFSGSGGRVRGCVIEGSSFGIHLEQSSSPEIAGCTFRDTSSAAIYAYYSSSPWIHDNELLGSAGFGIQATADPTIEGNTVTGYPVGIALGTDAGTVARNHITANGVGIQLNNNRAGWVHANTLMNNQLGVEATYSAGFFTDNLVARSGSHGFSIVSGYNYIDDKVYPQLLGNTVVETDEDGVYLEFADITLFSNIIAESGRYGVNDGTSRIRFGGNAFFANSSGDLRSGLEGDDQVNADPQFVDFDGGDYRLTVDSPCIDRGYNREDHTDGEDLAGDPRQRDGDGNGTVVADIGAYEYQPPCEDMDGDGEPAVSCGGLDCNDLDPDTYPGADEPEDSLDNDCDGLVDEDVVCQGGCCRTARQIGAAHGGGGLPAGLPGLLGAALALGICGMLRRRRP